MAILIPCSPSILGSYALIIQYKVIMNDWGKSEGSIGWSRYVPNYRITSAWCWTTTLELCWWNWWIWTFTDAVGSKGEDDIYWAGSKEKALSEINKVIPYMSIVKSSILRVEVAFVVSLNQTLPLMKILVYMRNWSFTRRREINCVWLLRALGCSWLH